jgi:hypothetical protein
MNADLMKICLANDMADFDCESNSLFDREERLSYYLNMRDFTLLEIWMDKCGLEMIAKPELICPN